jgi:hypothetical protein
VRKPSGLACSELWMELCSKVVYGGEFEAGD